MCDRIPTTRVVVTAANGFIGSHLIDDLLNKGHKVRAIVRSEQAALKVSASAGIFTIDNPHDADAWCAAVAGCDVVIHLIGLAHSAAKDVGGELQKFRDVNVGITECLLDACRETDVRRLIYLSSIKAVGEGASESYTEASECLPENAYGLSKREAELLILERIQGASIEASIVRSPVVYGPGVKGNMARMLKLVHSGLPLPIRCLKARRSMVYVRNLTDVLRCMVESRHPVEGIYHISDAEPPLATRDLFVELGRLMGKRVVEVPVPALVLRVIGRLVGMGEEVDRLTKSLTMQGARLTAELGWAPPYSMQDGLAATVQWFVDCDAGI